MLLAAKLLNVVVLSRHPGLPFHSESACLVSASALFGQLSTEVIGCGIGWPHAEPLGLALSLLASEVRPIDHDGIDIDELVGGVLEPAVK